MNHSTPTPEASTHLCFYPARGTFAEKLKGRRNIIKEILAGVTQHRYAGHREKIPSEEIQEILKAYIRGDLIKTINQYGDNFDNT